MSFKEIVAYVKGNLFLYASLMAFATVNFILLMAVLSTYFWIHVFGFMGWCV